MYFKSLKMVNFRKFRTTENIIDLLIQFYINYLLEIKIFQYCLNIYRMHWST